MQKSDREWKEPVTELPEGLQADESARQYHYIDRAREIVRAKSAELGRPLLYCVHTFGCQMNARDSEKLCGILQSMGYQETDMRKRRILLFIIPVP